MQKCQNEKYLAVLSGKKLVKDLTKINQLFVFEIGSSPGQDKSQCFNLYKRIRLVDNEIFFDASTNIHFLNNG